MFRTVYNFMNWLTDIGGLYGAIYAICLGVVSISQFQGANMLLMTELFGKPSTAPAGRNSKRLSASSPLALQRSTSIRGAKGSKSSDNFDVQWNCSRVIKLNLQLMCPAKFLCCCLKMKKENSRIFYNGYKELEKEVHINYVLK